MAMKWCTKLETAKERCPIVFQGHPSNFKVTRYKTSPILTLNGRFRTIGGSQLSNPSDLPCYSRKMHLELSSAKWWSFRLGLNVLRSRLLASYSTKIEVYWSLFKGIQLTISQHRCRSWPGTVQGTSHYWNQSWYSWSTLMLCNWYCISHPRHFRHILLAFCLADVLILQASLRLDIMGEILVCNI